MYNSRKRPLVDTPEEISSIWSCTNDKCNGWIRDNFVLSLQPICPHCKSTMVKSEKKVSVLVNTCPNQVKL